MLETLVLLFHRHVCPGLTSRTCEQHGLCCCASRRAIYVLISLVLCLLGLAFVQVLFLLIVRTETHGIHSQDRHLNGITPLQL
jgi:hypothetical protein